ncbi:hypothetical protein VUR80DRAFT_1130 [Thermomyces stellatus]
MPDNQPAAPPPLPGPSLPAPLATPTILQAASNGGGDDDGDKPLTSGEVGAILASITVVVILSLAALHLLLSRRRRRRHYRDDCSTTTTDSGEWISTATRENARVRETVERVDVNWGEGRGRRAPQPHEVKTYERIVPVYGNVRHVARPPATYFRG